MRWEGLIDNEGTKKHLIITEDFVESNNEWRNDMNSMNMNNLSQMPIFRPNYDYLRTEISESYSYAYEIQKAKKQADLEAEMIKAIDKEKTVVSHCFTELGYFRGKRFADGNQIFNVIANSNIVEVKRWVSKGIEYTRLCVEHLKVRDKELIWTPIFKVKELEKDKFVELLLSRYFYLAESRAYNRISIKEIRSKIYEIINNTEVESLPVKIGWNQDGEKIYYYDGTDCQLDNDIRSTFRCAEYGSNIQLENVLFNINNELDDIDKDNKLAFLIGYGLITWFSTICSVKWNARFNGSDIWDIADVEKAVLKEYVETIKDDVMLLDFFDLKNKISIVKTIISGHRIYNLDINVPIVIVQKKPDERLEFESAVFVDLNNLEFSGKFCFLMKQLKGALINKFQESIRNIKLEAFQYMCYEEASDCVFEFLECAFREWGISHLVIKNFLKKINQGKKIKQNYSGNADELMIFYFRSRMKEWINKGKIRIIKDFNTEADSNLKQAILIKKDSVFIPSKYLEKHILTLLNVEKSFFNRIQDKLIEKKMMNTYEDSKTKLKRITIAPNERIYAYEFNKEFFETILEDFL